MVIIIIGLIVLISFIIIETIIIVSDRKKLDKESMLFLDDYKKLFENDYIEKGTLEQFKNNNKEIYNHISKNKSNTFFHKKILVRLKEIIKKYNSFDKDIEEHNNTYYLNEKEKYKDLFIINGQQLDDDQINAIVSKEKNVLVAGSAGAGKTLTIVGKVLYLIKTKNIKPEDILLISYERKAATDMTDKISKLLGFELKSKTFHKLGLDIIKEYENKVPEVASNSLLHDILVDYIENKANDSHYLEQIIKYFAYYLNIPSDYNDFDTLGEKYEYDKYRDYETLKSKFIRNKVDIKDKVTLRQEQVKSFEELQIANYLFLHGINYQYESEYKLDVSDNKHKKYRPDFYLPEYDIYIEHFGVDKKGKTPWLSKEDEKKYLDELNWKRKVHKDNNTTLIESYSFYSSEGTLLKHLKDNLLDHNVMLKNVDFKEIFNVTYKKMGDKYFEQFINLCTSFIHLYKSNECSIEELEKIKPDNNHFYKRRREIFFNIIKPIIEEYNKVLKEKNMVDFDDMILKSKDYILNNNKYKYKYIIVDEYQDISSSRYKLLKAILDTTGASLFAVGDDFQSIFRFDGSDVFYFENFSNYYDNATIKVIRNTYRNSQELITLAGNFIMKNPDQVKKSLLSSKYKLNPLYFIMYDENPFKMLAKTIDSIIKNEGIDKNILLLGRINDDFKIIEESGLFDIKNNRIIYKKYPNVIINFMTVHRSKGLEADNVIILNFENSLMGFPNKISEDPLLKLVLKNKEGFRYAEERRLFYVAITRTKNRTFILTRKNRPSEFFKEFEGQKDVKIIDETENTESIICPNCKTGRLVVRKNESLGSYFLGCSNYPMCNYTTSDTTALNKQITCPKCGGFLVETVGVGYVYLRCSNSPRCDYTRDEPCPLCNEALKKELGAKGDYIVCSNYPKCKYRRKI